MATLGKLFGQNATDMAALSKELRKLGFDDGAINFVQSAKSGSINARTNVLPAILPHAQSSLVQFGATARNATETLTRFNAQTNSRGLKLSATATALIGAELLYASAKTQETHGGYEDALINNGGRIAAVTGATAGAVALLKSKRPGMRIAGGLAMAAAATLTGAGASQVAHEELASISIKQLETAKAELEQAIAMELEATQGQQEKLEAKRAEITLLQKDRQDILTGGNDGSDLETERTRLEEKINNIQQQIIAYDIVINPKKASPETLALADDFRQRGFQHVGINADGDASNDAQYKQLKQIDETTLRAARRDLAEINTQIEERRSNTDIAANLPPADKARLEQVDERIAALREEIQGISDGTYLTNLQNAVLRAQTDLDTLKDLQLDPEANIFEQLGDFATTDKGFTAAVSGTSFAMLSVMGGVAFESALASFANKGQSPNIPRGAVTLGGLPVNSILDDAVIAKHSDALQMQADLMRTNNGLRDTLEQVTRSHIHQYRNALEIAHSKGLIDDARFELVSQRLTKAEENLPKTLKQKTTLIDETAARMRGDEPKPAAKPRTTKPRRTPKPIAANTTNNVADLATAAKAVKAGRASSNIPALGVPIGLATMGAMNLLAGSQKAEAATLQENGLITADGLKAYEDMHERAYKDLFDDASLSIADPVGITLPVTLYFESKAEGLYREWFDAHGQKLSPELSAAISPSAFTTPTTRAEMIDAFRAIIPHDKDDQPEILHNLIDMKMDIIAHARRQPSTMMNPYAAKDYQQWHTDMAALRQDFDSQFRTVISNPQNLPTLLNLVPITDRLELVTRLARGEHNQSQFETQNPKIAAYTEWEEQNILLRQFDRSALNDIYKSPRAINAYIMQALGINDPHTQTAATVENVINTALDHADTSQATPTTTLAPNR